MILYKKGTDITCSCFGVGIKHWLFLLLCRVKMPLARVYVVDKATLLTPASVKKLYRYCLNGHNWIETGCGKLFIKTITVKVAVYMICKHVDTWSVTM